MSPDHSQLLNLSEPERAHLSDMRALGTDARGREVFVGLDRDETEWLLSYTANSILPFSEQDCELARHGDRYLELHDKHELVRLSIVNAEVERRDHPILQ